MSTLSRRERVKPHFWPDIRSQCWPWATSTGWCPEEQQGWYLSVQFVFEVLSEPWLLGMPSSAQNIYLQGAGWLGLFPDG